MSQSNTTLNYNNRSTNKNDISTMEKNSEPFRPKTGRNPQNRNANNMPVGMYLYEKGFMQHKKKDLQRRFFEDEAKQRTGTVKTNGMSDKIVEAMKMQRLEEVFNMMDSDNDGVICNSKIDISGLPTHILKTIAPLLIEMEQMNLILDFHSFLDAGEKLIKLLPIDERHNFVYGSGKRPCTGDANLTFKPVLNKKSLEMASNKRRLDGTSESVSLYGIGQAKSNKNVHVDDYRHGQAERNDLEECTFHPRINKYNPIRSHYAEF